MLTTHCCRIMSWASLDVLQLYAGEGEIGGRTAGVNVELTADTIDQELVSGEGDHGLACLHSVLLRTGTDAVAGDIRRAGRQFYQHLIVLDGERCFAGAAHVLANADQAFAIVLSGIAANAQSGAPLLSICVRFSPFSSAGQTAVLSACG